MDRNDEDIDVGGFSQEEQPQADAGTERSEVDSDEDDRDDNGEKGPNLRWQQDKAPPKEDDSVSEEEDLHGAL